MKSYDLLLIIGLLGILSGGYLIFSGKDTTTGTIGFVCAAALIMGWTQFRKQKKKE